jgi:hypothetical protein
MSVPCIVAKPTKSIVTDDIKLGNNVSSKRLVPIIFSGNNSNILQTPYFKVLSVSQTKHDDIIKLTTEVNIHTAREHEFFTFIDNMEDTISSEVSRKGSKWFSSKHVCMKSLIRETDDRANEYYIIWHIQIYDGIMVDEYENNVDVLELHEGSMVRFVVEVSDIWVNNNQFGMVTIVRRIMCASTETTDEEIERVDYKFHSEEESDDELVSLIATEQKNPTKTITLHRGEGSGDSGYSLS